jgi:hypothetical protein
MLDEIVAAFRRRGASPGAISLAERGAKAVSTLAAAGDGLMPPPPKAKNSAALPSYLRSATQSPDTFLIQDDLRLANLDIETLRFGRDSRDTIRKLSKASPDLSAAAFAANRVGIPEKYTVICYNLDGTLNKEGTALVQQLCRRFDKLGPSDGGYNAWPSIRASSESLGGELYRFGACSLEVVLNKGRLPEALQPIAVDTIEFKYQKKRKIPFQRLGGEEISLDYPTFFYTSLDQDLRSAYSDSPVESSIQPMIGIQAFVNDLRRVFRRAIHPRIKAMLDEEKWRKTVPPDILHDPEKLAEYQDLTIASIRNLVDNLEPEDAVILWDTLDISYLANGNISLSDEYKTMAGILDRKLAAGAKTMPAILGHDSLGSQNVASTQSMIYLKTVEGAIVFKLNEIYSRALTLCVRLFGIDAVVDFRYDRPNLRPESELEAFASMRQSRFLELCSVGLLTDEETSLELTGTLPPPGAPKLSGTFFKTATPHNVSTPESNTGALEQDLAGKTPKEPKS